MNNEILDNVAAELKKFDIKLSKKRIAFGMLIDFIADAREVRSGNTYRATEKAVASTERYDGRTTLVTLVCDERIVVTMTELKKLEGKEVDCIKYESETMELARYIELYYNGNHGTFAADMGVSQSKVSEWKRLGWVVHDGKLWSSKRTLQKGPEQEMASLPN